MSGVFLATDEHGFSRMKRRGLVVGGIGPRKTPKGTKRRRCF
jgi:hypothetical protein